MRHWHLRRGLLGGTACMMFVFACALMGCGGDSGSDNTVINGLVGLAAEDGASLAGLTFDFPDATIFGFPGESATLGVGAGATTFTLTTSGGTVIHGTITNVAGTVVSCQLTQNLQEVGAGKAPFNEVYDTCQASVNSAGEITFGGSGPGTVTLSFGRADGTAVASSPEDVTLHLHEVGTVTINDNTTPI
jgi:hypothetical protein